MTRVAGENRRELTEYRCTGCRCVLTVDGIRPEAVAVAAFFGWSERVTSRGLVAVCEFCQRTAS